MDGLDFSSAHNPFSNQDRNLIEKGPDTSTDETGDDMSHEKPSQQDNNNNNNKPSPFVYPSGVPGFGNSILGPRIPRISIPSFSMLESSSRHEEMEASEEVEEMEGVAFPSTGRPPSNDYRPDFNAVSSNAVLSTPEHKPTANNSNENTEVSEIHRLTGNLQHMLAPYANLHPTCAVTQPMQKILTALNAQNHTLITIMSLMHDAVELLKPLRDRQTVTIRKFSEAEGVFLRDGLDSFFYGTRAKTQQTVKDIHNLEQWIAECNGMPNI